MKTIILTVLSGSALIALYSPLAMASAEIPPIDPPALVECKTDATCDHDPKHLEAFVKQFYEWYVTNGDKFFSLSWAKTPSEEQKRNLYEYFDQKKRIMDRSVTAEYRAWNNKMLSAEPGTYGPDPRYCVPETDFILCAQAWNDDQIFHMDIRTLDMEKDITHIAISLPDPDAYQIIVRLKPVNGAWRIDGVTRDSY